MQGCQMANFQTKNTSVGKFWRNLEWKMLVCFMNIWNSLLPFGIYGCFYSLWSFGIFFSVLVLLDQENSGNPDTM
jgi:hypothetical protein